MPHLLLEDKESTRIDIVKKIRDYEGDFADRISNEVYNRLDDAGVKVTSTSATSWVGLRRRCRGLPTGSKER